MRNQSDWGSAVISPTYPIDNIGRVIHPVYRNEFDSQYMSFLPHGEDELKDRLVMASSLILQDHAKRIDIGSRFHFQENYLFDVSSTIGQQAVGSAVRIAYDNLVTLSNNVYTAKRMDGKDQFRAFKEAIAPVRELVMLLRSGQISGDFCASAESVLKSYFPPGSPSSVH